MAVMAREAWTDERLDDLTKRVDKGFEQVDKRFEHVDKRFEEVKGEIRDLRIEISGMQRTMIVGFATIAASTVGSVIATALVV
jgi:hypothetical protein